MMHFHNNSNIYTVINKHDTQNIIIGYNNLFSSASRVIDGQNDQRFESHSNIKRLTA
jgi:hypothetical protein